MKSTLALAAVLATATALVTTASAADQSRRIALRPGDFVDARSTRWSCSLGYDHRQRPQLFCSSDGDRSLVVSMQQDSVRVTRCFDNCARSKDLFSARR